MSRSLQQDVHELVMEMDRDVDAAIVEGKHDVAALEAAGFTGDIYTVSDATEGVTALGKRVVREADSIAILTDFDPEGRDLNRRLQEVIPESRNRKIWRKKLGTMLTATGRRDIESLNNLFD